MRTKIIQIVVPVLTALLLVIIWFNSGKLLATGESGLPFYNPQGQADFSKDTWSQGAIGLPTGAAVASNPFQQSIAYLNSIGIPEVLLQASFFFLCLVLAQISIIQLIKWLIPEIANKYLGTLVPAFFYISNLFAIVTVWNRFQYTFILLYSLLPLALLLFSKALKKKSLKYIILLNFIFVPFSIPLSSIPLIIVLWLLLGVYTLFEIISNRNDKKMILWCITALFTQLTFWILSSLWWILPFIETLRNSPFVTTEAYSAQGNISTLIQISDRLGNMSYLLRLMHRDFFADISPVWNNLSSNVVFTTLSFVPPFLAFLTLLVGRKTKYIYFFLFLSLVSIFLMKGSSPPFGFIFVFLFEKVRVLEALRNPFEKIGLLLPLGFAPLIGFSLVNLSEKFKFSSNFKSRNNILNYIAFIALFIILPFPLLNGWVFTSTTPPQNNKEIGYKVEVPNYYHQANKYLTEQTEDYRNIAFPYDGEGITYAWKYGYAGVDLYNGIFSTPFISFSTSIQFYKPIADSLEYIFFEYPNKFPQVMQILNAKHVVIRHDVDHKARQLTPSGSFDDQVKINHRGLNKATTIGDLNVYELQPELQLSKIYAANTIIQYPKKELNLLEKVIPFVEYQKADVLVADNQIPSEFTNSVKERLFQSSSVDSLQKITKETIVPLTNYHIAKENAFVELPYVKTLPDDLVYPLMRLREDIDDWSDRGTEQDNQFLALKRAGKRLVELYKSAEQNKEDNYIKDTANSYKSRIDQVKQSYVYESIGVQQELMRHKLVIEELSEKFPKVLEIKELNEVKQSLDALFSKGVRLKPEDNIEYKQKSHILVVPQDGQYSVTFKSLPLKNDLGDYYFSNNLYVNGTEYSINAAMEESIPISLIKGENTIVFEEDSLRGLYQQPIRSRIIFANQTNQLSPSVNLPKIEFNKINSADWRVFITNATSPYILVFAESFHPLWQLTINNQLPSTNQHFLANGYANAWVIDKAGDYQINLYFKAQDSLILGKQVSKIFLLFSSIVFLVLLVKKLIRK